MRAGCFAEDRVIELVNRRFVPFYFNRGGPGEGHDAAALRFVAGQTENQYAYLAAFRPTGEILGETDLYADKDAVAEWLRDLLVRYPEYAAMTADEAATMAATETAEQRLQGARLAEGLGDYDAADARYEDLAKHADAAIAAPALLGLLRLDRYRAKWQTHERHEAELRAHGAEHQVDADVERGYRLIALGDHAAARALLQPLSKRAASTQRHAEAHFLAGVACWFTDDRDWAKLHWGWILDRLANDRLAMRARVAAAAEGMPYVNPELGGFKADVGNIGTHNIDVAVRQAMQVYRQMVPFYEAADFTAKRPSGDDDKAAAGTGAEVANPASPTLLVARLRDGNEHVPANNLIVDELEAIGTNAIAPLQAAIEDRAFPGRGYAAWALACVLHETGSRDEQAMATLRKAGRDDDSYVVTLSRSGLSRLE